MRSGYERFTPSTFHSPEPHRSREVEIQRERWALSYTHRAVHVTVPVACAEFTFTQGEAGRLPAHAPRTRQEGAVAASSFATRVRLTKTSPGIGCPSSHGAVQPATRRLCAGTASVACTAGCSRRMPKRARQATWRTALPAHIEESWMGPRRVLASGHL